MAKSNITTIKADKLPRQSEEPIRIINDRLLQARSMLDLIHTRLQDSAFVDSLYNDTLARAVYSAILRIEEAMEAAETMHHAGQSTAGAKAVCS
jgi:hypothetical protein